MKFLGHILWFCLYYLQEIDTGLIKQDFFQQLHPEEPEENIFTMGVYQ